MQSLNGKKILLGITGGIAAYKCADLVRRLRSAGADVRVTMTQSAEAFITPLTLQALTDHEIHRNLLDPDSEAAMSHISLARWADVALIAPATANFLAHLAHGFADDLLSTLCLATDRPIAVAPAMNRLMWQNAATQDNVTLLRRRGVHIFGPGLGEQACGETGPGRMLEPAELVEHVGGLFKEPYLQGKRVLITAGPTREPIDPVRYITNKSSGKMGYAVAAAAAAAGADVTLVSGPVSLTTPVGVVRIDVETAAEMAEAVAGNLAGQDIYIGVAAVADYRPSETAERKIKKGEEQRELLLTKTQDILATVAASQCRPFTVGFAAETHDIEHYALDKLKRKGLDMIAANRVDGPQGGFDADDNALSVFWANGRENLPMSDKSLLAEKLMQLIARHYFQQGK